MALAVSGCGIGTDPLHRGIISQFEWVKIFAGSYTDAGAADGTGTDASFNRPTQMVISGDSIYTTDRQNHVVRKVVIASGVVTSFAGNNGISGSDNGTLIVAKFSYPDGIATNGTSLFVSDYSNHTIRKIDLSSSMVSTLAGSAGLSGTADGTGAAARFTNPAHLACDGTNLFVADFGNHTIRKVVIDSGVVSTIVGTAGTEGTTNGTGTTSTLSYPYGVVYSGTALYVSEVGNNSIRKVDLDTLAVTTFGGTLGTLGYRDGKQANSLFNVPSGLEMGDGELYIADNGNHAIRVMVLATGETRTILGNPTAEEDKDGWLETSSVMAPIGVLFTTTNLYVSNLTSIRKLR